MPTLYDLSLTTLPGEAASLADYAGKVLLIVNVASRCGMTPQYVALERLYQRFMDKGFVVLGFPANDFGGLEQGTGQEMAKFRATDFPVTFPLFSNIAVTGEEQHPLYTILTSEMPWHEAEGVDFRFNLDNYLSSAGLAATLPLPDVMWNFEKFLVGRDGRVVARFAPDVPPDSAKIVAAVEKALAA